MKKRYGLDSIIGKKSKLRIPRSVYMENLDLVTSTLPANCAEVEPPFSTNITMKKGDPFDVCDQFNERSCDYILSFPLQVIVSLSTSGCLVTAKSPTVYALTDIIHDLQDLDITLFGATVSDVLLANTNIALIKMDTRHDFFLSDILSGIKSIYGNIKSFNCKRKKQKYTQIVKPSVRKSRYLLNAINQINKKHHHALLLHYIKAGLFVNDQQHFPLEFERIDYYYDTFEDLDELYDWFNFDQRIVLLEHLYEYTLLAVLYYMFSHHQSTIDTASKSLQYVLAFHHIYKKAADKDPFYSDLILLCKDFYLLELDNDSFFLPKDNVDFLEKASSFIINDSTISEEASSLANIFNDENYL